MPISKIKEFAKNGQKSTEGIILENGFPIEEKPARQWFNYLFNSFALKTNEIIDVVDLNTNNISTLTTNLEETKLDTGITVTAKYPNSITRTQAEKNSDFVNVKDFGAVGDGVTDDTNAVQNAINSNSLVSFGNSGDSYKLQRLTLKSETRLTGVATLDFSQNTTYANSYELPLIKARGTTGEVILITSNVNQNDTVINVASTFGISSGDIIEIATPNNNGGFLDSSTTVHNGELVSVEEVLSGTTIKLSEPVIDEYGYSTTDNAQIRKINMLENITLDKGITIKGKGRPLSGNGDYGLVLHYAKNVKIHANFLNVDLAAFRFEGCYDVEVSRCNFYNNPKGESNALNYAVVPSGSTKHVKIFNNDFQNMRHGVVTSHLSSTLGLNVWGVSRLISIYNNTFSNTWAAAIATHNDADIVNIYNNTITNCVTGVNPRERNVWVYGNNFIANEKDILLSAHPKRVYIHDNMCYKRNGGSFLTSSFDGVRAISDLYICNNNLGNIINGRGIHLILSNENTSQDITISGNTIQSIQGDSALAAGVSVTQSSVKNLVIKNNIVKKVSVGLGIYLKDGGENVIICDNIIVCDSNEIGVSTQGAYSNLVAKANVIKTGGTKWSGADKAINYATIVSDNTWLS